MFNGEKMSLLPGRKHFRIIIQSKFDSRIKPVCKGLVCHHMVLESSSCSTQIYFKQKQKQNKLYACTQSFKKKKTKNNMRGENLHRKKQKCKLAYSAHPLSVCVCISFAMQHACYTS